MRVMGVLLGMVLAVWSHASWACSCRRSPLTFPPANATNVPLNVQIQITGVRFFSLKATLKGTRGAVETTLRSNGPSWWTVLPTSRLEQRSSYELLLEDEGDRWTIPLTTGDAIDEVAPGAPRLKGTQRSFTPSSSSCGDSEVIELDVQNDDAELVATVIFAGTRPETIGSAAALLLEPRVVDFSCRSEFPLRQTPDLALELRSVDAAGNLSEPSNPRQVKQLGCSASASTGLLPFLLVFLLRARVGRRRTVQNLDLV